jgi:hypothetical protein
MSQARQIEPKLPPPPDPDHRPEWLGVADGSMPHLPPLPEAALKTAELPEAVLKTAELPPLTTLRIRSGRPRARRAFNIVLILFLVGLAAFVLGIAIAYAVISGALDMQTGWLKEALGSFKDLAHHYTGK